MSTNVGVAEAYTDPGPKGDFCVWSVSGHLIFCIKFFMRSTKRYLNGQI